MKESSVKGVATGFGIILYVAITLSFMVIGLGVGFSIYLVDVNGIIVSPFPEVVEEYSPNSSNTCFYPTLSEKSDDTYACNLTNTNKKHFCPNDFTCVTLDSSTTPFGCQSEVMSCGS